MMHCIFLMYCGILTLTIMVQILCQMKITNLTLELVEEGFVRELISKIQTMRKEAGFEVMDKISIYYHADEKVADIFNKYENDIMGDVLGTEVVAEADSFDSGENGIYCKEWNINGEKVLLGVKKGEN